ncbi:MAG: hypothetical protein AAB250_14950, partial [Bdellovibrionota bacterium]
MRLLAVLAVSFMPTMALSALAKHRVVFEFPESVGPLRKLQVDVVDRNGKWFAEVKSLSDKSKTQTGELACTKLNADEFKCHRDDAGGGFELQLSPTPKLMVSFFTMNDEDEETDVELKAPKDQTLTF